MNYVWHTERNNSRQHWLYHGTRIKGLVYMLKPDAYGVYGEDFERNAYARKFLGVMPTLDEAKDMLLTITASQKI